MKAPFQALVLFLFALGAAESAQALTYQFAGTITSAVNGGPAGVAAGTPFSGSIKFDQSLNDSDASPSEGNYQHTSPLAASAQACRLVDFH